jgi:valyl-tRNA synthetase
MLANEKFTSKAPEHVVQQQRDRLARQQERRTRLVARIEALEN